MGYYADLLNAKSIQLTVFGKNYTIKDANDIYGIRTEITSERTKRIRAGENESSVNKEFDEANNKLKKIYELFPRDYDSKEKQEKDFAKLKSIVNSKEESMGYYADLIKQKQEKLNVKPFYTPGLSTKELKTRAEVERYMFEQRREVDKCISWMESTKKKIQEIEKEPKPHSIGWAERLRSAQGSYKQYKRWMEMHEDFAARAEDWLSKNRNSKDNEKEEKENAKTVNFLGQTYTFGEDKRKNSEIWQKLMRDGSNAREKAQDEYKRATREASEKYRKIDSDIGRQIDSLYSQLKEVLNSKEEKDNESPQIATARRKALQKLEDAQKKANWWGDTTMQKLKHDLTYADEENLLDVVGVLERYLPKFEAKVKSFGNSNEEKGYYAKLAEEKASRKN